MTDHGLPCTIAKPLPLAANRSIHSASADSSTLRQSGDIDAAGCARQPCPRGFVCDQ
jgi:hypothetical protein